MKSKNSIVENTVSSGDESDSKFEIVVDDYKEDKKSSKKIKSGKKVITKDDNKDIIKKTLVEGDDFKKLQRKAKRLGAKSLDYSNRKNNKYVVDYEGKEIHFGSNKY